MVNISGNEYVNNLYEDLSRWKIGEEIEINNKKELRSMVEAEKKREGNYRGKSSLDDKFVYGDLVGEEWILEEPVCGVAMCLDECLGNMLTPVDKKTVGRNSGEKDKNDIPIYENDILKLSLFSGAPKEFCTVRFNEGCFEAVGKGDDSIIFPALNFKQMKVYKKKESEEK